MGPSHMAITGIVVMAYVQASMALKNRAASIQSSTGAAVGADMDGVDFSKVMRREEAMEMHSPDQHQNVIRRQTGNVQTLGVNPKGSFKKMHPSLAEHTAGAAAAAHPGAAAAAAATTERPGAADTELQKAAAAQDKVSLKKVAAASIMKQQKAEASATLPEQTEETRFATQAAVAIAAAGSAVLAEVPYMGELKLGKNVPAPPTAAVTLPADTMPDSVKASLASPPLPEVMSYNTRVRSMLQHIHYPGFLGKRLPSFVLGAIMLAVASIALAGLWHANHPAPELSEWQKQHHLLVQQFQATAGEPIKQKQDLATAVGIKSTISNAESEEAKRQPSFVDSLKSMLRLQAN